MRGHDDPLIVHIMGPSNSGKTTLLTRLIPALRAAGARVGTVKHAHQGFDLDQPGKDSWQHAMAGAQAVAVVAPQRIAWLINTPREATLPDAIQQMVDHVDLILVEGFKGTVTSGMKVYLDASGDERLRIAGGTCRIGVFPSRLSATEIGQLTQLLMDQLATAGKG